MITISARPQKMLIYEEENELSEKFELTSFI